MSVVAGALASAACIAAAAAARSLGRERAWERTVAPLVVAPGPVRRVALADALAKPRVRTALALPFATAVGMSVARVPGAIVGCVAAIAAPHVAARRHAATARTLANEQLTDAVGAIAAALRAGLSLAQSMAFAAGECGAPLGPALAAISDRAGVGMPLGASIDTWARADGGRDSRLVAAVLGLHRRSGGDLPAVLDRVSETLRDRRSAARELRSLTAQARMSGTILGLLPIVFFCFLAVTSPSDLRAALESPAGATAIVVGFVMQAAAFLWIRRLLRVG